MAEDYIGFCERLWRDWVQHQVTVPRVFDRNAAPEPYLCFGVGAEPLVALTTNPGATMPHQRRRRVQAGDGPLCEKDEYAEAARKLGDFYETYLTGHARHRIAKLRMLSTCIGYKGVLQVELFPFHSRSLRMSTKNALLNATKTDRGGLLGCYVEHLREFLRDRPVVSPQAVSTLASLRLETPKSFPWLTQVAKVAGLDLNDVEFVPLVEKGSKTTAAAWVAKKGIRKALVLMMGTNNLPAYEGLGVLAAALRKFWRLR
jgi:hypothetical protein